jgi:DNA-binding response OmpR family regulator
VQLMAHPCASRSLLAEYNFDSAEILSLLLEREGFDVRVALDGLEALSVLQDFSPDVAILDLGMPGPRATSSRPSPS